MPLFALQEIRNGAAFCAVHAWFCCVIMRMSCWHVRSRAAPAVPSRSGGMGPSRAGCRRQQWPRMACRPRTRRCSGCGSWPLQASAPAPPVRLLSAGLYVCPSQCLCSGIGGVEVCSRNRSVHLADSHLSCAHTLQMKRNCATCPARTPRSRTRTSRGPLRSGPPPPQPAGRRAPVRSASDSLDPGRLASWRRSKRWKLRRGRHGPVGRPQAAAAARRCSRGCSRAAGTGSRSMRRSAACRRRPAVTQRPRRGLLGALASAEAGSWARRTCTGRPTRRRCATPQTWRPLPHTAPAPQGELLGLFEPSLGASSAHHIEDSAKGVCLLQHHMVRRADLVCAWFAAGPL